MDILCESCGAYYQHLLVTFEQTEELGNCFFCNSHLNLCVEHNMIFTCKFCDHAFSSLQNLRHHEKLHDQRRTTNCHICNFSVSAFSKSETNNCMRRHIKIYHPWTIGTQSINLIINRTNHNNPWSCQPKSINSRLHRKKKYHQCPTCHQPFLTKGSLYNHWVNLNNHPWKCWTCKKHFKTKCALSNHVNRTHGIK